MTHALYRNTRIAVQTSLMTLVVACGGGGGDGGASSPDQGTGASGGSPSGEANKPPQITGVPQLSVLVSQTYSFQPQAADPDGQALTFTAAKLPPWMSLDARSGKLSGAPTTADLGMYDDITLSVSDGRATATLPPFSVAVTDVASGSATLSWAPPTENADGSPLLNLAGYEIRYGRDQTDLSNLVTLNNPSLSIYLVENLTAGTWYFAVAAVNSSGISSPLSNLASKAIG